MAMLNQRIKAILMPARMRRLRVSSQGYPVPWFVAWVDGEPEFRAIEPGRMSNAWIKKRCWLCGEQLGKYLSFVIGPMCMVNQINSEPPSHHDCAQYAVKACPFLAHPRMRRNEKDLPEHDGMPGIAIARNPGVIVIWTTLSYKPFRVDNGVLFKLGEPTSIEFWTEGREATRAEVLASIDSGLPALQEVAKLEGQLAIDQLMVSYERALRRVARPEEEQ